MNARPAAHDGLLLEALLHTLRRLTPAAQGLCLALLGLYLVSGVRVVGPGESALVLRLGRLLPKVHGPGLLLAWPAPIDEVVLLPTGAEQARSLDHWAARGPRVAHAGEIRQYSTAEITAYQAANPGNNLPLPEKMAVVGDSLDPVADGYTITGDWNIVQGRFTLRYRIADARAYFCTADRREALLDNLSYQALAATLSRVKIDDSLTAGRDRVAAEVRRQVQAAADRLGLGVTVTAFEIRELRPPRQVAPAFDDVVNARLFAKTVLENAEEYHLKQLALTQGQAAAIRQRAEAQAAELVASAQGEAEAFHAFYAEYRRAPLLVATRLYWETLEHVMQQAHSSTLLPAAQAPVSVMVEPAADAAR